MHDIERALNNGLPTLTTKQIKLSNAFLRLFCSSEHNDDALAAVANWLSSFTSIAYQRIELHHVASYTITGNHWDFGDAFLTRFRLPPEHDFGLLAIDRQLIQMWCRAILDDQALEIPRHVPMHDFESGLAIYTLLRILEILHEYGFPPVVVPGAQPDRELLLEHFCSQSNDIVEAVLRIKIDRKSFLTRILIPETFLDKLSKFSEQSSDIMTVAKRLERSALQALILRLPVVLGSVNLPFMAIHSLEKGDLIFISNHGLNADGVSSTNEHFGSVWLSEENYLQCTLSYDDDAHWRIKIVEDTSTPAPKRNFLTDHTTQFTSDPQKYMCNDENERTLQSAHTAKLPLEIRIGYVPLTPGELAGIHNGKTIILPKRVIEPVELVVHGQVLGTGELLNVEGRLGVRVLRCFNP